MCKICKWFVQPLGISLRSIERVNNVPIYCGLAGNCWNDKYLGLIKEHEIYDYWSERNLCTRLRMSAPWQLAYLKKVDGYIVGTVIVDYDHLY